RHRYPAPDPRLRRPRRTDGHARACRLAPPRAVGPDAAQHRVLRAHGRARRALRKLRAPPVGGSMTESVAVIGFAEAPAGMATTTNGVEMLVPIFQRVLADTGLHRADIDFWCSGSSDYLAGRAFSFVTAVDAIGAVPPIAESHVEADAAW